MAAGGISFQCGPGPPCVLEGDRALAADASGPVMRSTTPTDSKPMAPSLTSSTCAHAAAQVRAHVGTYMSAHVGGSGTCMVRHVPSCAHTSQRVSSTAMSSGSKAARSAASAMMEIDSLAPLAETDIEKKRRDASSRSLKKMSSMSVAKHALTLSSANVATRHCRSIGVSRTFVVDGR